MDKSIPYHWKLAQCLDDTGHCDINRIKRKCLSGVFIHQRYQEWKFHSSTLKPLRKQGNWHHQGIAVRLQQISLQHLWGYELWYWFQLSSYDSFEYVYAKWQQAQMLPEKHAIWQNSVVIGHGIPEETIASVQSRWWFRAGFPWTGYACLAHCNGPKLPFPPDTGNHTKNKKDKPRALHLTRQWKLLQTIQLSSGLVSAQDYDDPIK